MGWDNSRPVPWRRLVREWVIYAGIMTAVVLLVFRPDNPAGSVAGVLISGPLYLLIGAGMAKLGYQRPTLRGMNTPRASASPKSSGSSAAPSRSRPAPTKRTSGGPNRPRSNRSRR